VAPDGSAIGVGSGVAGGSLWAGVSAGSGLAGSDEGALEGSAEGGAMVPASGERGVSVPPLPTLEQATETSAMIAMSART
jgi:hypothetical protein